MKFPRSCFALILAMAASVASGQSPGEVVERYLAAYNNHDVAAMLALAHPDIQWLSIEGHRVRVETEGAEALGKALRDYFDVVPSARSTIDSKMVSGNRVSVRERVHWESAAGPKAQAALSVYEIDDGLVRRVWYFPAE